MSRGPAPVCAKAIKPCVAGDCTRGRNGEAGRSEGEYELDRVNCGLGRRGGEPTYEQTADEGEHHGREGPA